MAVLQDATAPEYSTRRTPRPVIFPVERNALPCHRNSAGEGSRSRTRGERAFAESVRAARVTGARVHCTASILRASSAAPRITAGPGITLTVLHVPRIVSHHDERGRTAPLCSSVPPACTGLLRHEGYEEKRKNNGIMR